MKKTTLWIARTAIALALLIAVQYLTGLTGQQLITGSCVNLLLALCTIVLGVWTGVTIAALSPLFAFLFGIGPKMIQVVPAIAVGNLVYVIVIALILALFRKSSNRAMPILGGYVGIAVGAACKFAALYGLIVCWIAPTFLPAKAAPVISASFGVMQLFTALIGGAIAATIAPVISKAMHSRS